MKLIRPLLLLTVLACQARLEAANYYWDATPDGTSTLDYGSGTISTSAANWWPASGASYVGWTNSASDTINIGASGTLNGKSYTGGTTAPAFTLTLSGAITAQQIIVSGVLNSGNSVTISDGGNSANTLSIANSGNFGNNSASSALIIDAQVIGGGSNGIGKINGGTVIFAQNNTYTGATTISGQTGSNGGVLQIGNGGTTGSVGTGTITFSSITGQTAASTLRYNRSNATTVTNSVTSLSANAVGGTIEQAGSHSLTMSGNVTINNASATMTYKIGETGQDIDATVSGVISSVGSLAKTGAGTLLLTNTNTYSGTTTVSEGTLLVNGSLSASSVVTVASGATLGGSGTIGGNTTVNGNLAPGNSPGQITFTNNLTLAGTTTLEILNSLLPVQGADYDAVRVGGLLSYGGELKLTMNAAIENGTYYLFDGLGAEGSSLTQGGNFSSILFDGSAYTGVFSQAGSVWSATSGGQLFSFDLGTGDLTVTAAVPEPSSLALAALGLTGLLLARRRAGAQG